MDRDQGIAFCREKTEKETTLRHLISVEGVMRVLARRFGEDEDVWALTGLFHDLDQDQTGEDGMGHAEVAAGWLREAGVDGRVVNGVL
ncbi:MAG TPA: HDIG domain-containing protein, partial [Actinomycetota bacterium]|nr:HDIG domain-containing protein [Actinomycetota bacterium]